jgi:hypothetical protein
MKHVPIMILAFALLNFDYVATSAELNGKWVDVNTKTDTLTFETRDKKDYIILTRGKEIRNGRNVPKSCIGLYSYKLLPGDKITLSWILSSVDRPNAYHFKQRGDFIDMEEFYCMKKTGTKLTFKKLN